MTPARDTVRYTTRALRLARNGVTARQLAEDVGISRNAALDILHRLKALGEIERVKSTKPAGRPGRAGIRWGYREVRG